MKLRATLSVLAALVAGCTVHGHIPDGAYTAIEPAVGTLTIRGSDVAFDMVSADPRTQRSKGTYSYGVARDGSIYLRGSSNDAYFVFELINYEWRWTGEAIVRTDHDGATVGFIQLGQRD